MRIHHFILTRFNLCLWSFDKNGEKIDHEHWLDARLPIFESFTLPSIQKQSCQDFEWILLVDAATTERYRHIINTYKELFPKIHIVGVKHEQSKYYANIFAQVVRKRLSERSAAPSDICLTTYFDNDDMLDAKYIERTQSISLTLPFHSPLFISFDYGLQYFTEIDVTTRIKYPNNHFITLLEYAENVKTCYGYGSHFLLEKKKTATVYHVKDKNHPMWTEVVHKDNVDNDVKMTLDTRIIDSRLSVKGYCSWVLRAGKQVIRRIKDKIIPRKW